MNESLGKLIHGLEQKPEREQLPAFQEFLKSKIDFEAPRIEFTVFLGAHHTYDDFGKFADAVKEVAVYVPEMPYLTDEVREDYESVSAGKKQAAQIQPTSQFVYAEMQALFNTHKIIAFADIGADHELIRDFEEISKESGKAVSDKSLTFTQAAPLIAEGYRKFGVLERERQNIILSNLYDALVEAIKDHAEDFKQKAELKIGIMMGSLHTRIYQKLKEAGNNVHEEMASVKPHVYPSYTEIARRAIFEKSVEHVAEEQELAENAATELMLMHSGYLNEFELSDERVARIRSLVAELSRPDKEKIFLIFRKHFKRPKKCLQVITALLLTKG